jgi:protein-S-isoprenylcysteine O-methyltransferase Ste14
MGQDSASNKANLKALFLTVIILAITAVFFFVAAAGRFDLPRAWIYFIALFVCFVTTTILIARFNPELLIHRLKKHSGTKTWDQVLMRLTNLFGVYFPIIIAGLDTGRYQWSSIDPRFMILGLVLLFAGNSLTAWAMVKNTHFEPVVRIQGDRSHQVVSDGPYRFVRHPGYLGGLLFYFSTPLILGSAYAFIPAAIGTVLITLRTALEDRTLRKELSGYHQFAEHTRYRLLPLIW